MKSISSLLVLTALLALSGCGKSEKTAKPQQTPATPSASTPVAVNAAETTAAPPPPTSSDTLAAAPAAAAAAPAAEPDIAALEAALKGYMGEFNRIPANFEQIVQSGYLAKVPQAPAGMKYVLDTKNKKVTLVSQ
ncbi:MAG TPA: hypothetical protein VK968_10475 [Roseimicrobium sp.]|nr:hypothetical protein [Roseimicrobium sp.]